MSTSQASTPIRAAATASETTPLLASTDQDAAGPPQSAQVPSPTPPGREQTAEPAAPSPPRRDMVALPYLSLLLSLLSASLLIAFFAVYDTQDPRDRPTYWGVRECGTNDIFLSLFAAAISSLNLFRLHRHGRPLWLSANLTADTVIAFFLSIYTTECWNGAFRSDCNPDTKRPRCKDVAPVLEALLRGGLSLCFGLGFAHLVLAMKRLGAVCVAFFRLIAGRGDSWSVPAGQLTFEFSIRLMRPGERDAAASA